MPQQQNEKTGEIKSQPSKHHVLQLYEYHSWANQKVFGRLKELPESVYTEQVVSVFSSVSEVMQHILIADNVYYGVMSEAGFDEIIADIARVKTEIAGIGIEAMEAKYQELYERYKLLFAQQEHMDRAITTTHPQYGRLDTQFSQLVQHVCNHGTYHRGHISAMLRQMGHPGVATDYIFYLFEAQNTAHQDMRE